MPEVPASLNDIEYIRNIFLFWNRVRMSNYSFLNFCLLYIPSYPHIQFKYQKEKIKMTNKNMKLFFTPNKKDVKMGLFVVFLFFLFLNFNL